MSVVSCRQDLSLLSVPTTQRAGVWHCHLARSDRWLAELSPNMNFLTTAKVGDDHRSEEHLFRIPAVSLPRWWCGSDGSPRPSAERTNARTRACTGRARSVSDARPPRARSLRSLRSLSRPDGHSGLPPRAPTNGLLGFPFGFLGASGRLPKARRERRVYRAVHHHHHGLTATHIRVRGGLLTTPSQRTGAPLGIYELCLITFAWPSPTAAQGPTTNKDQQGQGPRPCPAFCEP